MKKIRFLFISCFIAVFSSLNAQVVIFTPSTDKSEINDPYSPQSISKDGVTISLDYYDYDKKGTQGCGALFRDDNYRIYMGGLLTISYNAGNIVEVVLVKDENVGNDLRTLKALSEGIYEFKSKNTIATWTGRTDKVLFHNENRVLGFSKITVTVEKGNFFSISESGYATFYIDVPYVMPNGVTGYTISDVKDGFLEYGTTYTAGETVPEGVPLLLKGEKNDYAYTVVSEQTGMTKPENMLKGSDGNKVESENSLLYKLSYDDQDKDVGFYWDSKDGKSIEIPAGKAYLEVPKEKASAKGFTLDEKPNSISEIHDVKDADGKVFSISGQYVGRNTKGLAKGIYVRNGKKIIVH